MTTSDETRTTVTAVRVAPDPTAAAELPGAGYVDAFRVPAVPGRTAATWARGLLGSGGSAATNAFLRLAFRGGLGLRLAAPGTPGTLSGWTVVTEEPGRYVLAADGPLMAARLVLGAGADEFTWTTLVRFHRPAGRRVWRVAGTIHRALVPRLMGRASA